MKKRHQEKTQALKKKKQKQKGKWAIFFCFVILFVVIFRWRNPDTWDKTMSVFTNRNGEEEWSLILVNEKYPLPENFVAKTESLDNGMQFDTRAIQNLKMMIEEGNRQGLSLMICSAYRSVERQKELFEQEVQDYKEQGYSDEEAAAKAKKMVAVPGASEHNLGLAADICADYHQTLDEAFGETPEGVWLREHAADYGFILRYPKEKEAITGISYEPWHFRYVGKNHAKEMMKNQLCLEEYVEKGYAADIK